ncbi:PREDICTED: histidine kinase 5 [Erythranthe guttata]|uniref:histidine kinase 5 n=1 Tax=Erythranthe guttata TaxID=4155 RepID=UPI00064DFCE2|nr:PREDICTED: histidine kinase 5 [Erythranthe guttata]|eukprot:XP_012847019.1 PREDICTED: histidine kinase 5 [Erythranthe guttata]
MGCEMETEEHESEEMDIVLSSMWPEDINEAGRQFNVEKPSADQDMLEEVTINKEPNIVDFKRLMELTNYSDKGNWQLANLIKNWEYKQANAVRLLKEEIDNLSKQQQEVELKKLEILEEHRFERDVYSGDKRPISILDENLKYLYQSAPRVKKDLIFEKKKVEIDAEYDSVVYWKQRGEHLEKLLEASLQRERVLLEKLQESIANLETQSSPVEELSQVLTRADNFLHFVLQNAPVVIGHQDKELRYRFIFNHFPSLGEEDIIGKTDVEIFSGAGVKESQDFKKEVLEKGLPAKREITFETELFGSKTFLIYVEPVFSKTGETIGVNYMGMEITDQVRKREKMAKIREEMAVQKAKETELTKTIHITEESMRAKQMLATMSHEIRSPLSGVVSMAEILSTTRLDKEQRQLLGVMLSSGDLVLQLINDILDLSKVESGVMKLEATKFRPREVVKHVLQTAAASLQKLLVLEGHIADDVPVEVIGDVLRIRQILTNLVSNAIKFTHEGKVGINLYIVRDPGTIIKQDSLSHSQDQSNASDSNMKDDHKEIFENGVSMDQEKDSHTNSEESVVWIRCDVYDTGIGIPENAMPTLFKKYMQVGADTARKYGGTGLGLAICKQLVELMGGHLTVSSTEKQGSTFTFVLPHKLSTISDSSEELSDTDHQDILNDENDDDLSSGVFVFQPRTLGSLFSSQGSGRIQKLPPDSHGFQCSNGQTEDLSSLSPCSNVTYQETVSEEDLNGETSHSPQTCSDNNLNSDESCRFQPCDETSQTSVETHVVVTYDNRDRTNGSSECISSNKSPEIPKTEAKPKILLVDDNKINVMVAKSMMKQLGHDMDVVHNGAEAVRAVQSNGYHLVLMDVCMPVMDGLEATRLIRSFEETGNWDEAVKAGVEITDSPFSHSCPNSHLNEPRKRIPIVAMTANALSESADECYANGMDSFVSKPVTFQNLRQCLQQYLP